MATVVVNNRAVVLGFKNITGILGHLKVIEFLIVSV
jgi:hypothetical protein